VPQERTKAALLSLFLLCVVLGAWEVNARPPSTGANQGADAALLATDASAAHVPPPSAVIRRAIVELSDPFYDRGPNDKGIGIQLAYSLGRVAAGYLLAALCAIPIGFVVGMLPVMMRALNPFIQVLKPISPLAWMPIALFVIKDSTTSSIFVIFVCSIWPMLINTAFGVASVHRDYVNVARTLELSDDLDRNADFDRHLLARDRGGRDARGRHRCRLLRLE
jgi:nitrate/nitrite transport system permease protein